MKLNNGVEVVLQLSNGIEIISIPDRSGLTETQKKLWEEWIEALENDSYRQTTSKLRLGDSYCCLGVFCDLVKDKVNGKWRKSVSSGHGSIFEINDGDSISQASLPGQVRELGGFDWGEGFIMQTKNCTGGKWHQRKISLANLNDAGASFKDIARILRKALGGGLNP